ncbi:MAG: DUF4810 domain-containing protein [Candidatus Accumulibacter sp.]|jgi:hypothetical protein|nr:DUF4810 domain-containing protein [Accumulibacter sp.]
MGKYRYAVLLACAFLLGGCVAPRSGLYRWNNYDQTLYESYKDADKTGELVTGLETLAVDLEKEQLRMPPGLYAELGTLYLQMGELDKAIGMYTKERDTWPESKGLMDALITNLQKRLKPASTPASASEPASASIPPPPPPSKPSPSQKKAKAK